MGTGGSSVGAATAHLMGSAVAPAARSSRAAPVVRAFASFIMVDRWWLGVGHSLRSAARGSRQILSSGLRSISLSTPPSSSLGGGRSGAWRRGRAGAEPGAAGPPGPRKIGDAAPGAEFRPRRPSWRRRRLGTPPLNGAAMRAPTRSLGRGRNARKIRGGAGARAAHCPRAASAALVPRSAGSEAPPDQVEGPAQRRCAAGLLHAASRRRSGTIMHRSADDRSTGTKKDISID